MKKTAILLTSFLLITNACGKKSEGRDNDPLPNSRPEKFTVSYNVDGGMVYYSENLYLSADSCVYTINDGGIISKTFFKLSAAGLDSLYNIFKENNFDEIKTRQEKVYDRGGSGIKLGWDNGKYASVNNSGMTFIEKGWTKEWTACLNAVKDLLKRETEKLKKDYEIRVDKAFNGKVISVNVKNETVLPMAAVIIDNDYISKSVRLLPGSQRMSVSFNQKYERIQINPDSSKGIYFELKNDSLLTWSFINN